MPVAGFGRTQIRYDMFDLERDAEAAKRLVRCEGLYHRGQSMAWDGKEVLAMLLEQHGGIQVSERHKEALKRVFAIILWGELAAWKISAQLADRLVPLEAKMAATSQSFDEARHFYVMFDYLKELGYVPERMDRAPQALLDMVLGTDDLAEKLLGMQLMVETIALAIFQSVRESGVEPVLCELMKYYERDEARHVGLGMQYLPELLAEKSAPSMMKLSLFQVRLLTWALSEAKLLEDDFAVLGVDVRKVIDRVVRKQVAAMRETYATIGIDLSSDNVIINRGLRAVIDGVFPEQGQPRDLGSRLGAAWDAVRGRNLQEFSLSEFDVHNRHRIKLAKGGFSDGDAPESDAGTAAKAAAS